MLDTRAQLSCLTVVLRCVSEPHQLALCQPGTFEAMLRLLCALGSGNATSEPLLQLLRSQYDSLTLLVPAVICTPLPEEVTSLLVPLYTSPFRCCQSVVQYWQRAAAMDLSSLRCSCTYRS